MPIHLPMWRLREAGETEAGGRRFERHTVGYAPFSKRAWRLASLPPMLGAISLLRIKSSRRGAGESNAAPSRAPSVFKTAPAPRPGYPPRRPGPRGGGGGPGRARRRRQVDSNHKPRRAHAAFQAGPNARFGSASVEVLFVNKKKSVGTTGFEPAIFRPPGERFCQAKLRPEMPRKNVRGHDVTHPHESCGTASEASAARNGEQ
jgi:hypothetical protein